MKILEIENQETWNDFIAKNGGFLSSWEWGAFQESVGNESRRLAVEDGGEIVAALLLIKKKTPLGNYCYSPGIEFLTSNDEFPPAAQRAGRIKYLNFLISETAKVLKGYGLIFLRIENNFKIQNSLSADEAGKFKIKKSLDIQPRKTIILNLGKAEDELMKEMHQKTRYNIRLAEKKGIVVRAAEGEADFETFWQLMSETVERDGFRLHGKEYYRKMLSNPPTPLSEKGGDNHMPPFSNLSSEEGEGDRGDSSLFRAKLFLAEHEGKVLAAGIFSFFGQTATYIHGASSNENRNLMAPYLLQWRMIQEAKRRGCRRYDFYGIDETKWPGVTRFKRGFGGAEVTSEGTHDIVFNIFKYRLYQFLRRLRRLL